MEAERFRFLIDEAGLRLFTDSKPDELNSALERLVEIIQEVRAHPIGKLSSVWEEQIGQHPLYDWLFDHTLGIDRDVAGALQVALSRTPDWDTLWGTAGISVEVAIGATKEVAFSVAAAARETRARRATACLSPHLSRSGRLSVIAADGPTGVHFVCEPAHVRAFFRDVPETEDLDEDGYFENAPFAFPNLHFVRDRTRFNNFEERYETVRPRVTAHLAVLNDHAKAILCLPDGPAAKIGMFGSHGVEASGESPKTRHDQDAMNQRDVHVDGEVVVCNWHTKIRRHLDRIYFNATSHDRVIIGVFHRHLD